MLSSVFCVPWDNLHTLLRPKRVSSKNTQLHFSAEKLLPTFFVAGICPLLCSGHGVYGGGRCHCVDGWKGPECEVRETECLLADCSGHGQCREGVCLCNPGWTGENCQIRKLFKSFFPRGATWAGVPGRFCLHFPGSSTWAAPACRADRFQNQNQNNQGSISVASTLEA